MFHYVFFYLYELTALVFLCHYHAENEIVAKLFQMVLKSDSIFSVHNSISFDKIQTPLAGMQPQIMTGPPLCFTVDTPVLTMI